MSGLTTLKDVPHAVSSSAHGRALSALTSDRGCIYLLHDRDHLCLGVVQLLRQLRHRNGVRLGVGFALCDDGVGRVQLGLGRA